METNLESEFNKITKNNKTINYTTNIVFNNNKIYYIKTNKLYIYDIVKKSKQKFYIMLNFKYDNNEMRRVRKDEINNIDLNYYEGINLFILKCNKGIYLLNDSDGLLLENNENRDTVIFDLIGNFDYDSVVSYKINKLFNNIIGILLKNNYFYIFDLDNNIDIPFYNKELKVNHMFDKLVDFEFLLSENSNPLSIKLKDLSILFITKEGVYYELGPIILPNIIISDKLCNKITENFNIDKEGYSYLLDNSSTPLNTINATMINNYLENNKNIKLSIIADNCFKIKQKSKIFIYKSDSYCYIINVLNNYLLINILKLDKNSYNYIYSIANIKLDEDINIDNKIYFKDNILTYLNKNIFMNINLEILNVYNINTNNNKLIKDSINKISNNKDLDIVNFIYISENSSIFIYKKNNINKDNLSFNIFLTNSNYNINNSNKNNTSITNIFNSNGYTDNKKNAENLSIDIENITDLLKNYNYDTNNLSNNDSFIDNANNKVLELSKKCRKVLKITKKNYLNYINSIANIKKYTKEGEIFTTAKKLLEIEENNKTIESKIKSITEKIANNKDIISNKENIKILELIKISENNLLDIKTNKLKILQNKEKELKKLINDEDILSALNDIYPNFIKEAMQIINNNA